MGRPVGYSGTPLPQKLGIQPGHRVLLDGAPAGFVLDGVTPHRRPGREPYDVMLVFCPDFAVLARRWRALHGRTTPAGALWIAWPKRGAGLATDLDGTIVREYGLANGRVDVKVCAIDETWSGLKFVIRVSDR